MSAHPHLSGRAENDRMLDLASTGRLSCLFVLSGGAQERTPKPHEQRVSSCLGKNLKFPQKTTVRSEKGRVGMVCTSPSGSFNYNGLWKRYRAESCQMGRPCQLTGKSIEQVSPVWRSGPSTVSANGDVARSCPCSAEESLACCKACATPFGIASSSRQACYVARVL